MKIVVSPYWNKTSKILLFVDALLSFFAFYMLIYDNTFEGFIILGGCTLVFILITAWLLYGVRRLLTKVVVTDLVFESVLFSRSQCFVDRNKKIYYMIIKCSEAVYSSKEFIIISNHFFKYEPEKNFYSRQIISYYDIKEQIIMPYNSSTCMLCDLENWTNQGTVL